MPCYFFSGDKYIKVLRTDEAPGAVELGYPKPITVWNWDGFGKNGIDAALYSDTVDYFFKGKEYIRVTRGGHNHGKVDAGYPKSISTWGWGEFGKDGINAALYSGSKYYFFSGLEYIRVTRDDTGPGKMDPGYPKPITDWGWGAFGLFGGIRGAMNSGDVDYFFSLNEYIRVRRDDTGKGKIDPGYPAPIWHWGWGEFGASGIDAALFSGTDTVPGSVAATPATGLGSNSNYYLGNSCKNLVGVTITINITEDIVLKSSSGDTKGFGFQLNCYSGDGERNAWQQYVISIFDDDMYAVMNNWPLTGKNYLTLDYEDLFSLPNKRLPAGYQLKIELKNDAHEKVLGAVYKVIDHHGQLVGQQKIMTLDLSGAPADYVAPIKAFQLNLVGPANSESSVLSSGAGHFIYEADTPIEVLSSRPSCAESHYVTAETANSEYGTLHAGPFAAFTQTFNVTDESRMVRVKENVHPGTGLKLPPRK